MSIVARSELIARGSPRISKWRARESSFFCSPYTRCVRIGFNLPVFLAGERGWNLHLLNGERFFLGDSAPSWCELVLICETTVVAMEDSVGNSGLMK